MFLTIDTDTPMTTPTPTTTPMDEFVRLKGEGNTLLDVGELQGAIEKYTEALVASQGISDYKECCKAAAIALGNRSLAQLRLGNAQKAMEDGMRCKARDPTYHTAQLRIDEANKVLAAESEAAEAAAARNRRRNWALLAAAAAVVAAAAIAAAGV